MLPGERRMDSVHDKGLPGDAGDLESAFGIAIAPDLIERPTVCWTRCQELMHNVLFCSIIYFLLFYFVDLLFHSFILKIDS